jgi:hypothetical protein
MVPPPQLDPMSPGAKRVLVLIALVASAAGAVAVLALGLLLVP